jgi:hypothetical protein
MLTGRFVAAAESFLIPGYALQIQRFLIDCSGPNLVGVKK